MCVCVCLSVCLSLCMLLCAYGRETDRQTDKQRQTETQTDHVHCVNKTTRHVLFCLFSFFVRLCFFQTGVFSLPVSGFSTSTERVTVLQCDVYGDCLSVTASLAGTVDLIRVRSPTTVVAKLHSSLTNEQVHWLISCHSTGE